jgi:Flp pilus assembly protein TadG
VADHAWLVAFFFGAAAGAAVTAWSMAPAARRLEAALREAAGLLADVATDDRTPPDVETAALAGIGRAWDALEPATPCRRPEEDMPF